MRAVLITFLSFAILSSNSFALAQAASKQPSQQTAAAAVTAKPAVAFDAAEFDRLRTEGNDSLYNLDYQSARATLRADDKDGPGPPGGLRQPR